MQGRGQTVGLDVLMQVLQHLLLACGELHGVNYYTNPEGLSPLQAVSQTDQLAVSTGHLRAAPPGSADQTRINAVLRASVDIHRTEADTKQHSA